MRKVLCAVLLGSLIVLLCHGISPDRQAAVLREQQQEQQQQEAAATADAAADVQQLVEQQEPAEEEEEWHFRQMESGSLQGEPKCPAKPQDKSGQPKTRWPELVGKPADAAQAALEREAPGFRIQVIGPDSFATMDWRCDRIRIWLDKQRLVSQPPMIG